MLTDAKIRNTKPDAKPIRLADSGGLMIEVRPNGSKLWRYRFRLAGKASMYAIGDYPGVSLQEARRARDDARDLVRRGINPAHHRQAGKLATIDASRNTFAVVANEYLAKMAKSWTPKHHAGMQRLLQANAFPSFGHLPIHDIGAGAVLAAMTRMEARDAKTYAIQLRQIVSAVFNYAIATQRAEADPTHSLRGAIIRDPVQHAEQIQDIGQLLAKLDNYGGRRQTVLAIQLLLHTFVRGAELRPIQRHEFNLAAMEWRIPAKRMKARRPHVVPLTPHTKLLVEELIDLADGKPFLLPNMRQPDQFMGASTLNRALEYLQIDQQVTAHDFRATASTTLYESGLFRGEVIEMQLAHVDRNNTRASYNHAKYLPERRELMRWWDDHIDQQKNGYIEINSTRNSIILIST